MFIYKAIYVHSVDRALCECFEFWFTAQMVLIDSLSITTCIILALMFLVCFKYIVPQKTWGKGILDICSSMAEFYTNYPQGHDLMRGKVITRLYTTSKTEGWGEVNVIKYWPCKSIHSPNPIKPLIMATTVPFYSYWIKV